MIYYSFITEEKYLKYKSIHEAEHEAAIELLAAALKNEYGITSLPPVLEGEHGKPYFAENKICFNLSHCKGLAVCALSKEQIGIDCEAVGRMSEKAARKIFSAEEKAEWENTDESLKPEFFVRIWTAKEAYGKAIGKGLYSGISDITVMNSDKCGDFFIAEHKISDTDKKFIITASAKKLSDIKNRPSEIKL